jgi:hypothetical protein
MQAMTIGYERITIIVSFNRISLIYSFLFSLVGYLYFIFDIDVIIFVFYLGTPQHLDISGSLAFYNLSLVLIFKVLLVF